MVDSTLQPAFVNSPVEPRAMRDAMGRFATGVVVVTTQDAEGTPHGMTANSMTSVSLDPALLLVCFNHGARTAAAIRESGTFAVSVLGAGQEAIARRFAARGDDHFAGLPLDFGPIGAPVVPGALSQASCLVEREIEAGDHIVMFGAVQHVQHRDGAPLVFNRGRFGDYVDRGEEPVTTWF